MPWEYEIDSVRGIVFSRAWGVVTDEDLFAHRAALSADPRFRSSFNQFADLRDVADARGLSAAAIHALAQRNPFGAGSRRAFVTSTRAIYGLARMFQILTEESPDQLRVVFDEARLAERWLGMRDGPDPPA